jgi:hypothetical protein
MASFQPLSDALSTSVPPSSSDCSSPRARFRQWLLSRISSDLLGHATNIAVPPSPIIMDNWFDLLQCTCVGVQYKKSSGRLYLGLRSLDQAWHHGCNLARSNNHGGTASSIIRLNRAANEHPDRSAVRFGHRDRSASLKRYEGSMLCGRDRSSIPLRMACTETRPPRRSEPQYGCFHQGVRS